MENCPPSPAVLTPAKKRKSWFESSGCLSYSIAVEKTGAPVSPPDTEIEVLTLTHFSAPPRVDFGEVKIGKEKCRLLRVKNPEDFEQKVLIEKFPYSKNFGIDREKFAVKAGGELLLNITWTPDAAGNCRQMILFRVDGVYRLQAYVFGSVREPSKPSKRKGIGNRGPKKPFGHSIQNQQNVQTKSIASRDALDKPSEFRSSDTVVLCPNDAAFVDTPTRRATFIKKEPLSSLENSPVLRTTFHKDDPALPQTPIRRTTFMKNDSFLPNTPIIYSPLGISNLSQSSISEEAPVIKKELLKDVSQTPSILEEKLVQLQQTPDSFLRKDNLSDNASPVVSNYCTAFTSPYLSPEQLSDDEIFHDSLMYTTKPSDTGDSDDVLMDEVQEITTRVGATEFVVVDTTTKITKKTSKVDIEIITTETEHILKFTPTKNQSLNELKDLQLPFTLSPSVADQVSLVASTPLVGSSSNQGLTDFVAPSPINSDTVTKSKPSVSESTPMSMKKSRKDLFSISDKRRLSDKSRRRRRVSSQTVSKPTSVEDLKRLSGIGPKELLDFQVTSVMTSDLPPAQDDVTHIAFPMPPSDESFPVHVADMQTIAPSPVIKRTVRQQRKPTAPPMEKKRRSLSGGTIHERARPCKPSVTAKASTQIQPSEPKLVLTRTQTLRRAAALNLRANKGKPSAKEVTKTMRRRSGGRKSPHKAAKPAVPSRLLLMKKSTKSTDAPPKHPLPYAAKNMYYDERWLQKQEKGFTSWLNFVLTPEEYVDAKKPKKINAQSLCLEAPEKRKPNLAPTKEALSFKAYSAKKRLNRLRRSACALFQSDECVKVTEKLEREITCGRIMIRTDRKVHVDLGIKQKILDLLLCYNPLWLRMGLETVFGELIFLHNNADVVALSRFILNRLLCDPDLMAEYSHPTVPHLIKDGFDVAMAKFMLKKFLLLIYFMDLAKQSHLIDHDPCLFCKNSDIKASKDVLTTFAKDYLRGEGDINRHLGHFGYKVSHVQTPLDEFDFAVSNLASDLRDGVRLTRVLEMLTGTWTLHSTLRVPAISRLQKIHNVGIALRMLTAKEVPLETTKGGKVEARDIVDGHREKTHALLWSIIFNFQVDFMLNSKQLEEEIAFLKEHFHLHSCLAALDSSHVDIETLGLPRDKRESLEPRAFFKCQTLGLLLKWCAIVCAHYGMKVENFTVSFSDGRALCYLLHHYHPNLLPLSSICEETSLSQHMEDAAETSCNGEDSFMENWTQAVSPNEKEKLEKLLLNERHNFKVLHEKVAELGGIPLMVKCSDMSNTIPDEKVVVTFVSYLCARLLDLRDETKAARKIQAWWRRQRLQANIEGYKKLEAVRAKAAVCIQSAVQSFLSRRRTIRRNKAAVQIQALWKKYSKRKRFLRLREAVICLQQKHRAVLIGKQVRSELARRDSAARVIQTHVRCHLRKRMAVATKIQAWMRMVKTKRNYEQMKNAATLIQTAYRRFTQRSYFIELKRAALMIQSTFRMYRERKKFIALKSAAIGIQRMYRSKIFTKERRLKFLEMRAAALKLQSVYRGHLVRKEIEQQGAALLLQRAWRSHQKRILYQQHYAARLIQTKYRGYRNRIEYLQKLDAVVTMQSFVRRVLVKRRLSEQSQAVAILQRYWRATLVQRRQRKEYADLCHTVIICQRLFRQRLKQRRQAAMKIQSVWRMYLARLEFTDQKRAAIVIQAWFRGIKHKKEYDRTKEAVILIQLRYRVWKQGLQQRTAFLEQCRAAICLQSVIRMHLQLKHYEQQKNAVVRIQNFVRSRQALKKFCALKNAAVIIQRKWRQRSAYHCARMEYLLLKRATKFLQNAFRRGKLLKIQSAKKIQSVWRMHHARQQFMTKKRASLVIQSHFRGFQQRQRYKMSLKSVAIIQRRWREFKKTEECHEKFLHMRKSVLVIQRWFRAQRLQFRNRAALKIQSCYRMHVQHKQFSVMRSAAVKIQSLVRMSKAQKKFHAQRSAVCLLQSHFRGHQVKREERLRFLRMKQSAILIQRVFREYLSQQKSQHSAATLIQTSWRGYAQRKRFAQLKRVCVTIQQLYRATQKAKDQQNSFLRMKEAAICLQRAFRLMKQRQITSQVIAEGYRAAVIIQSAVRSFLVRTEKRKQNSAALIIQQKWRALYNGQKARKEVRLQRAASIVIQTAWRRFYGQKRYMQLRQSVICIQSVFRGLRQRKDFTNKQNAAVHLQRWYRALVIGRRCRTDFVQKTNAAIVIQSFMRRRRAEKKFKLARHSAIKIQSFYRMHLQRKRLVLLIAAVVKIQSVIRMSLVQKGFLAKKRAVCVLQKHIKSHQAMKKERSEFLRLKNSAILIQYAFRNYARQQSMQQKAATLIQSAWKTHVQKKRFTQLKEVCVMMQRRYRATQMAKDHQKGFVNMQHSAICIQRAFRAMRKQRMLAESQLEKEKIKAVVDLQRFVRGFLSRRRLARMTNAASIIQRYWKALQVGRQVRGELLLQRAASIVIQTAWRRASAQKKYSQVRDSSITIQFHYRCCRERKRFVVLRSAVLILQRCWRATIEMKKYRSEFQRQRNAAVVIQSMWRGRVAKREYAAMRTGFTKLCAIARGRIEREKFLKAKLQVKNKAARIIQRSIRSYVRAKSERRKYAAATTIQSIVRCHQAVVKYRRTVESAIRIQSHFRMFSVRKLVTAEMKVRNDAAVVIQSVFRHHILTKRTQEAEVRRKYVVYKFAAVARYHLMAVRIQRWWIHKKALMESCRQITSVITIQRWMRSCLLRIATRKRAEAKRVAAAVVIQAVWKGRAVRRKCRSKAVRAICQQVIAANRKATADQTLGSRMRRAVDNLFKHKQLAYVLESVMEIDVATRLSHICCRELVQHCAIPVVFRVIRSCNRSVPHMEIVKYSINILINLAKYEATRSSVYEQPGSVDCLIELMQLYREKGSVFFKACLLLGILAFNPKHRQEITANRKVVDKVHSIHKLISRKHKMEKDRKLVQTKMAACRSLSATLPVVMPTVEAPRISPEWVLSNNKMNEIKDPMTAIMFVMEMLRLNVNFV